MGNFFPDNKMLCGNVPFKKEVHAEKKDVVKTICRII